MTPQETLDRLERQAHKEAELGRPEQQIALSLIADSRTLAAVLAKVQDDIRREQATAHIERSLFSRGIEAEAKKIFSIIEGCA